MTTSIDTAITTIARAVALREEALFEGRWTDARNALNEARRVIDNVEADAIETWDGGADFDGGDPAERFEPGICDD